MTEEDIKALVRGVKTGLAEDFDRIQRGLDRLEAKLTYFERRFALFESEMRSRLTTLETR